MSDVINFTLDNAEPPLAISPNSEISQYSVKPLLIETADESSMQESRKSDNVTNMLPSLNEKELARDQDYLTIDQVYEGDSNGRREAAENMYLQAMAEIMAPVRLVDTNNREFGGGGLGKEIPETYDSTVFREAEGSQTPSEILSHIASSDPSEPDNQVGYTVYAQENKTQSDLDNLWDMLSSLRRQARQANDAAGYESFDAMQAALCRLLVRHFMHPKVTESYSRLYNAWPNKFLSYMDKKGKMVLPSWLYSPDFKYVARAWLDENNYETLAEAEKNLEMQLSHGNMSTDEQAHIGLTQYSEWLGNIENQPIEIIDKAITVLMRCAKGKHHVDLVVETEHMLQDFNFRINLDQADIVARGILIYAKELVESGEDCYSLVYEHAQLVLSQLEMRSELELDGFGCYDLRGSELRSVV